MNITAYLQGGPKQLYIFQHTISLELFKKKNETDFTKMFLVLSGTKIMLL